MVDTAAPATPVSDGTANIPAVATQATVADPAPAGVVRPADNENDDGEEYPEGALIIVGLCGLVVSFSGYLSPF